MNQKPTSILFRQRLELLLITQRGDVLNRAKEIIHQYHMSFKNFDNFEDVGRDSLNAQVVLIAQEESEALGTFSHRVEIVLSRFPKAWIVTVLHDSSLQENLEGTQFDRVVPLSPGEFFNTLKLDFICLLRARSQYFEFPVTDLFPMTTLNFSVFVRLELNRRYLAAGFKNAVLSESKFQKLGLATPLYFQLNEGVDYYQHIIKYFDTSGTGFKKRVRAVFLSICAVWLRIQEYLLFDYKKTSHELIDQHFTVLQEQITHLLELMNSSTQDDMWEIFREALNNDLLNEFRAPWFGAYAGFMAIKSKKGNPKTAFLAALFSDVGLCDLDKAIALKYIHEGETGLTEDERTQIKDHPMLSLNRCLVKQLPLPEDVKAVLVTVHERVDGQGYPNQTPADKLPVESHLIRFAEMIDFLARTKMTDPTANFRMLREKLWTEEEKNPGNFPPELLAAIADCLV